MAPTVAVCSSVLQEKSQEPVVKGSTKESVSLDTRVCLPTTPKKEHPASSQFSFGGSSCTTQKDFPGAKTLALDVSQEEEEEEEEEVLSRETFVCETPKSKQHRIPVVDVDLCPPAPKKPRTRTRTRTACSSERGSSPTFLQKLSFSPIHLF